MPRREVVACCTSAAGVVGVLTLRMCVSLRALQFGGSFAVLDLWHHGRCLRGVLCQVGEQLDISRIQSQPKGVSRHPACLPEKAGRHRSTVYTLCACAESGAGLGSQS